MTSNAPPEGPQEPAAVGPPLVAYLVLLLVYVGLGFFLKSFVLNWIIGPLFPLLGLYFLPRLFGAAASKSPG